MRTLAAELAEAQEKAVKTKKVGRGRGRPQAKFYRLEGTSSWFRDGSARQGLFAYLEKASFLALGPVGRPSEVRVRLVDASKIRALTRNEKQLIYKLAETGALELIYE